MQEIIIIGAGLSGTLLVINLLRNNSNQEFQIYWIDRNNEYDLGAAYSTNEEHLLNVPVEKMGAFSNEPEHFLNWCRTNKISAQAGDYLPRKLYREYIHTILANEISKTGGKKKLKRIIGEAADININKNKAYVTVNESKELSGDKVVLALGNLPPKNPDTINKLYLRDIRYKPDPWKPDIFKNLKPDDAIIFIGSGQTMIDLAAALYRKNHKGKLSSISRHGILPMSQKIIKPYVSFYDELKNLTGILPVFQIIRKHIKFAAKKGIDPRAVIDSLRPYTRDIWQKLAHEEKMKFQRHIYRYWEIIRSRIPLVNEKIINEMQLSGQLRIAAGRITDIITSDDFLQLKYFDRNSKIEKTEPANFIINCMGPNPDYEQTDHRLIKSLIKKGMISCDQLHLGINALPDGNVLKGDGTPSNILYTIGPPLRGILWESIAVPEIRLDAEKLASHLSLVNSN